MKKCHTSLIVTAALIVGSISSPTRAEYSPNHKNAAVAAKMADSGVALSAQAKAAL